MRLLKFAVIIFFTSSLCYCSTPYKRGDWLDGWMGGFVNTRIDANTAIISFRGNYFTSPKQAQNYAMYRAAEITINAGYNYFIVTNATELPPDNRFNHYYQIPCPQKNAHTSVIAIKMFQGNVPYSLPNAYDAKEIITHLGSIIY